MPQLELGSFLDEAQAANYAAHANEEAAHYIELIAAGNVAARDLMWSVWNFEHLYDDLVDRDRAVTVGEAAQVLVEFVRNLSFNPFWEEHKWMLFPLLLNAANRWVDGEEWPDKKEAAIIRCGDVDFFLQVAYCVGGWDHMRACKAARSYDKE